MKRILMFTLAISLSAPYPNAGKSELFRLSGKAFKGGVQVTQRINAPVVLEKINNGILKTTRSASARLASPGYKLSKAISVEDIINVKLHDGSYLRINIISEADAIKKSLKSRLNISTNTESNAFLLDLKMIFADYSDIYFIGTRDGVKTAKTEIDLTRIDDVNNAMSKLVASINNGTFGTEHFKSVIRTRKALAAAQGSR